MRTRRFALLAVLALGALLVLAAGPATAANRAVPPCAASALGGNFALIPGSPGAGNVVYSLQLRNDSKSTCFVSGLPGLRLLNAFGGALPTNAQAERLGILTAVRVVLAPGASAWATARFSPDVPGPDEQTSGQCEPVAARVRVTVPPGGGSLVAALAPPTSVCEHGSMSLSPLSSVRPQDAVGTPALSPTPTSLPDCLGRPQVRPATVTLTCADANYSIVKLAWTGWGRTFAAARGTAVVNDCTPTCVAGHVHRYPAVIVASGAQRCPGDLTSYRTVTVAIVGRAPVLDKMPTDWPFRCK